MSLSDPLFLWLPLLAVAAHLVEEFVWPGGFAEWFRWYHPERAPSVTTPFLVAINALLVVLVMLPPILGRSPRGLALWLVAAAVAASNALFHIYATARGKRYSPGLVTGTLLYLPLGWLGLRELAMTGAVNRPTAIQALIIGIAYPLWSSWTHRRRAAKMAPVQGQGTGTL